MKPNKNIISILILISILSCGFYKGDGGKKTSKILTNDFYNSISRNQIKIFISNNGDGSHDPYIYGSGLFWPGGVFAYQNAVFEDGLVWGGIINGDTVVGGSTFNHGLQAGKILVNGNADDPSLPKYRVYKVYRNWESLPEGPDKDLYKQDYNEWPAEDGAPFVDVNHDGIYTAGIDSPYVGDETMWCVSNDLDSVRTKHLYGSIPIGLEMQTLVYEFDRLGFLKNTVFRKYKLINKGQYTITNMILAFWIDDDLGDPNNDFSGCDTLLNLGYTYNSTDTDYVYGTPPPAVGQMLVQGPVIPGNPTDSAIINNKWRKGYKNLPMTAFTLYINSSSVYSDPPLTRGAKEIYNNMNGLFWNGNPYIDPNTMQTTIFPVSGDPVAGTGWYMGQGWPGGQILCDTRILICSGPFTMAPGDTQEIAFATFLAQGSDNIQSVASLKEEAVQIQNFYRTSVITGIEDNSENQPRTFQLMQNYPNPFNPTTRISWQSPVSSWQTLKVYDVLGREVETLVNEFKPAGKYEVEFNASNLPSGIYFYRIQATPIGGQAGDFIQTKKMVLLK